MQELTCEELRKIIAAREDVFLLDVRQPEEFEQSCINGSTLIPLADLPGRLDEVPRDRRVVVTCKSGGRSARAITLMADSGFLDLWNLVGGNDRWQTLYADKNFQE